MKLTRRGFLKTTAAGAAGYVAWKGGFVTPRGWAYQVSPGVRKFIDPLPKFVTQTNLLMAGSGARTIPISWPDSATYSYTDPVTLVKTEWDYHRVTAGAFRESVSSDMANVFPGYGGTRFYGYTPAQQLDSTTLTPAPGTPTQLGAPILAKFRKPVRLNVTDALPATHIIPFDATVMNTVGFVAPTTQDRIAIHLHGGRVPWPSDGGPFHWFDPAGNQGSSQVAWLPDAAGAPTYDFLYPNDQSPRFMWYHDHAYGTTRTTAYAGAATGYVLLADDAGTLVANRLVESDTGLFVGEVLVVQDKVFWDPARDPGYATVVSGAQPGDLWYPYIYDPAIWGLAPGGAPPVPSAVAEMFGDTMMVNGICYPREMVNPGQYRYRILNACNSRFLNLSFVKEDPANLGEPLLDAKGVPVPAPVNVWQIATEGGYLASTVQLFAAGVPTFAAFPGVGGPLLVGNAERPDIVVDFSACAGTNVLLYNDAPGPFPGGAPNFDFFFGDVLNPNAPTVAGVGPNTRTLVKFEVQATGAGTVSGFAGTYVPPTPHLLPTMNAATPAAGNSAPLKLNTAALATHPYFKFFTLKAGTRDLTLNEDFDAYGRLRQLVGTTTKLHPAGFGREYLDPPTETVTYGTIEIWRIFNLSADTHPMHVHLFNAMILSRQPFSTRRFTGVPRFTGPARGPDPTERGWKETFKMHPGECITLAVAVEGPLSIESVDAVGNVISITHANRVVDVPTSNPAFPTGKIPTTLPTSPRLAAMTPPIVGDEYVWHCHILEHEEHDMMRPLVGV